MATITKERVYQVLSRVVDPEIPVLTIADLGILRSITFEGETVVVTITPTYSGCPAMDMIRDEITAALAEAGVAECEVRTQYAPAWTTDWMSEGGRRRLAEFGIAPPLPVDGPVTPILCPRCASTETQTVSDFGSTACKALRVCDNCGEPFDYFKAI